ncbi:hypothetical protein BDV96DRAFT_580187 [Lophiotrema nucula]|uniref:Rhodopsin domain-containing protein n=1 Tax=Lophiotrema nucula TaxID=690887 RepID=A0A6A5YZV7_9PLEO|nr:hypothetical protein BDV96DRAFT_580187 [Lophiotrema nucula]
MSTDVIPPPYVITTDDKRGLVVVITATTLSFVWTCSLIRIWMRWKTREWKSDDYLLAAATLMDTIQSGLVFHIVNEGLGRSEESSSDVDLNLIGKDDFASQILYILTLLLSKSAVIFLYTRLSPRRDHHIASWATLAVSAAWALMSIILIATPCNPLKFWIDGPDRCPDIYTKWKAIGALDIITEFAIFLISVYLVAKLNMKTKSKVVVVAAFSARLPVIAASAVRLVYLRTFLTSSDRKLDAAFYVVCTQWQLGYAIMSTTITGLGPFLRPFGSSFVSSYRRSSFSNSKGLAESGNVSGQHDLAVNSYPMSPLSGQHTAVITKKKSISGISGSTEGSITGGSSHVGILPPLHLRPDMTNMKRDTAVSGGESDEQQSFERMSDESRRMMITKKTELRVETDRASNVSRHGGSYGVERL